MMSLRVLSNSFLCLCLFLSNTVSASRFDCVTGNSLTDGEVLYNKQGVCDDATNPNGASLKIELGLFNNDSKNRYQLQFYRRNRKTKKEKILKRWTIPARADYLLISEYGQLIIINQEAGRIWQRGCAQNQPISSGDAALTMRNDGPELVVNGIVEWYYDYVTDTEFDRCESTNP